MTFRRRQCLGLLGVAALMPAVVIPADGESERAAERVFETINARLSWMDDVARYKRVNAIPVEDLEREVIVIDKALTGAAEAGLDAESIEQFFIAQIAAAKAIQYRCLAQWQFESPKMPVPDLVEDIRPDLIRIGAEFLARQASYLSRYGSYSEDEWPLFLKVVTVPRLTVLEKRRLFVALSKVSLNN